MKNFTPEQQTRVDVCGQTDLFRNIHKGVPDDLPLLLGIGDEAEQISFFRGEDSGARLRLNRCMAVHEAKAGLFNCEKGNMHTNKEQSYKFYQGK